MPTTVHELRGQSYMRHRPSYAGILHESRRPGYSGAFVGYIKRHPSINQTNHPDQLPAYGLAVDASAAPDRVVGRRGLRISASFRLVVAVLRQRPSRFPT